MKLGQEKTHAGWRMRKEEEEEHPWGGRLLRAGLVWEAQAGVRGAARAAAATLVHRRCSSGRMAQEERTQPCGVTLLLGLPELLGRL